MSRAAIVPLGATALILLAKLLLVWRINVNWDEFYYLSQVHEHLRGDLTGVLQRTHVHFFTWLEAIAAGEMEQIAAARVVMWLGLVVTSVLIALLAARWSGRTAAWFAPLTYLAASPVLKHGGSFRADSLLAPLGLTVLLLLTSTRIDTRRMLIAGVLFGLSAAISIKTVLLAPLALLLLWSSVPDELASNRVKLTIARTTAFGAGALAALATALGLHRASLPTGSGSSVQADAADAARKTLLEAPLFPRLDYLFPTLEADWVGWTLILVGFVIALARARRAALLVLSLSPLIFYRNAFPYYYVVMLAPAAALAAIAVDALFRAARHGDETPRWLPVAVSVPLALQAALNLAELRHDRQENQRLVIAAVHEIFPEPVPYIDHSGMIGSFPKSNFFMSSWGLDNYRDRGAGFMAPLLADIRPPLLLANTSLLMPDSPAFELLLEEDRRAIERSYLPYWGPIRVAGAEVVLDSPTAFLLELPFPGRYRIETEADVRVDGRVLGNGAVVELGPDAGAATTSLERTGAAPVAVRLVWAGAMAPPPGPELPPFAMLYSEL